MTEQKEETKPTKPLTLSTTARAGAAKSSDATQVRQKFSHGRTRAVTVEVKKPVKRPGGAIDVYLPRGDDWIDLDTGVRHAGGTLLALHVDIATIPHFGRVGYILPLGPEIDRVDAMNEAQPLDEAWVFGDAMHQRQGFAQLEHLREGDKLRVRCNAGAVREF